MNITEEIFTQKLNQASAKVYIVGGWVRDHLRGVTPHDKDYMVAGITEDAFRELFPQAQKVGRSFPVFLLSVDGQNCEVAFARKERKSGPGYHGFDVSYDPEVTVAEDLYRRDTTMNSMAIELPSQNLCDPYGGAVDVQQQQIRAVSAHFCEDPVRALRAARQAAEFGFDITDETYDYMRTCREELQAEPTERLLQELRRALSAARPSIFFRALARANLLSATFPELAALMGKTQPVAFHPEGDAFEHTMLVLDTVAAETDSLIARFGALVHDLGKGTTPKYMEPHHYGHELRGQEVLKQWNTRMILPREWLQGGLFVIREHMRAPRLEKTAKIVDLLLSLERSSMSIADFQAIIRADHHGLPYYLEKAMFFIAAMKQVTGCNCPPGLVGKQIGEWIRNQQLIVYRNVLINLENTEKNC